MIVTPSTSPRQVVKTVNAGESIILKKNTKIISVIKDGSVSIQSSCPEYDDILNSAEDYSCYGFVTTTQTSNGSNTEPFANNNLYYEGVMLDGQKYLFPTRIAYNEGGAPLDAAMVSIPGIDKLIKSSISQHAGESGYGEKRYTIIKIPASIAPKLFLICYTDLKFRGEDGAKMYAYVPCQKQADIKAVNDNVPDCV